MICIYKQDNNNYTNNGDAVLIPTVCDLAMTINGAWQLKIEHPYDPEERYKLITEGAIIRIELECIAELETVYQLFRVYQYTKGLHSIEAIAFPVAMESTYDAPIDNLVISGKTGAQAMAQLQTFTNKYTLSSDVTVTGSSSYNNTNINEAIASGNDNSFIQVWGGEILYDNYKFKVKTRLGDDTAGDHRVMYGRNLTNIEYEKDDSGIITRISPISQDNIRLDGTGYVDSSHISDYPVAHHKYETAPYTLVDTEATSPSQTATLTRQAVAAVSAQADTLSHSAWTTASGAGYQPEYIKSIKTEITEAVQNMALANVVSTSLYNLMKTTIANAMAWLGDLKQPKWEWMGSDQTGWKYGNATSYAKNMYVKIGKTWSYFGSDGNWQEPKDDSEEWDWHDVKNGTGKKYGNFNKYFAHNEYVYITQSGTIKEYWFNEQGWFEEDESGDSEYYWHGSGTGADPYWFGKDSSTYLKSCWRFIDGTYYFFDSYGYVAAQKDNYQWDWVESGDASRAWFGNAINSEYGSEGACLKSQWEKINGTWYYFDANGIVQSEAVSQTNAIAVFTTGMSGLTTTVDNWKGKLYSLLYSLMRSYCAWRYKQKIDLPAITIKVDMADLSKTEEYKDFADLEKIRLGDSVECIDYEHNISTTNRVIGITYDCILKSNKDITIGEAAATVAQMVGNAQGEAVTGGFDTSALETQLAALRNGKQDKLTAGDNITIENNVISASGSGQGLEYWVETSEDFSRSVTEQIPHGWTFDQKYGRDEWDVTVVDDSTTRNWSQTTSYPIPIVLCQWGDNGEAEWVGFIAISDKASDVAYSGESTSYNISGTTFYYGGYAGALPVSNNAHYSDKDGVIDIGFKGTYEECLEYALKLFNIKVGSYHKNTGIGIEDNIIWGGDRVSEDEDFPFYVKADGTIYSTRRIVGIGADAHLYSEAEWEIFVAGLYTGYEYKKADGGKALIGNFGYALNQRVILVSNEASATKWLWRVRNSEGIWQDMSSYQGSDVNLGVSFNYKGASWFATCIQCISGTQSPASVHGVDQIDGSVGDTTDESVIALAKHFIDLTNAEGYSYRQLMMGTGNRVFEYKKDDEVLAYVNDDGTSSFDTVEANPDGSASAKLSKVEIDGTIYNVEEVYCGDSTPSATLGSNNSVYYKYTHTSGTQDDEITLPTFTDDVASHITMDLTKYTSAKFNYSDLNGNLHDKTVTISDLPETSNPQWNIGGDIYIGNGYLYVVASRDSTGLWIKECGGSLKKLYGEYTANEYTITNRYVKIDGQWVLDSTGGGGTQEQADWNQTDATAVDYIKNKPSIPEIEANPSDTASETLSKLEIDGTVYGISSGGGGSFYKKTTAEYDALPQADKTDPNKLYFIDDGSEQSTELDPTQWVNTYEASMRIAVTNDKLTYTWYGSTDIGANSVYTVAIPASVNKVRFKITTGSSYYNSYGQQERFKVFVGARPTYTTGFINAPEISDWVAIKNFSTSNSEWEDELDLSSVDEDVYLYISAHGWNLIVDSLQLVTESGETNNCIYYQNTKYADSSGSKLPLTVEDGKLCIIYET